ncbi:MAG: hypothetical protein Udaeo2_26340 [Candidatus Udaeobacter sp.]|nr:MAG: hypothetical protein Udaeo2_26340 [Candidatus Udaeobacter sp.]
MAVLPLLTLMGTHVSTTLQATESRKISRMLRGVRRTLVEFDDPQRPVIRLSRLSATDFAAHILEQSDGPLTAEEIHSRAIQAFGTKIIRCEAGAIGNALSSNQSVFGWARPVRYAQTFQVAGFRMEPRRGEFVQLLAKEGRPISCCLKDH